MSEARPGLGRLYALLPAEHRARDSKGGWPLRTLLAVVEEELQRVQEDVEGLYDDWFVETCAEWVVPYIGDLLRVPLLHPGKAGVYSVRAHVANTIAYRRRKGTATVLEQLARDTTGWESRAVEFFPLLARAQHLVDVHLDRVTTPDLRDTASLELLGTAFDPIQHVVEVRSMRRGGRHNIPNVGLFLWLLQSNWLACTDARAIDSAQGRFVVQPVLLREDLAMFNRPRPEPEITHLAEEHNVSAPLRRRALYEERLAVLDGGAKPRFFDPNQPVFEVHLPSPGGGFAALSLGELAVCHLGRPGAPWPARPSPPLRAAIDPETGRILLAEGETADAVRLGYAYGSPGDLGGGPYHRFATLAGLFDTPPDWIAVVTAQHTGGAGWRFDTLTAAIAAWNAAVGGPEPPRFGLVAIHDSATYEGNARIDVPAGAHLTVLAARWPDLGTCEAPLVPQRVPGGEHIRAFVPDEVRPHVRGTLRVRATAAAQDPDKGSVTIDGVLLEGRLLVEDGQLGGLRVRHCTVVHGLPQAAGVVVAEGHAELTVEVSRSVVFGVRIDDTVHDAELVESLIDGRDGWAIDAEASHVGIRACTVLGRGRVRSIDAGNAIFSDRLAVARRQIGCVRYSYVPPGSLAPRRFRCQPVLAAQERGVAEAVVDPSVRPVFQSRRYGDAAYGMLAPSTADEVAAGAEDGAEMGVFQFLQQPQRTANLRVSLEAYLRFGLEAGLFFERAGGQGEG